MTIIRGALPRFSGERAEVVPGNRERCDGCNQNINPPDEQHIVVTADNTITLRLHADCYNNWVTPK